MLIPVLSERAYDYGGFSAGVGTTVVLAKSLDVLRYRAGVLLVRVHAANIGGLGSPAVAIRAYLTAPSVDEPAGEFVDTSSAKAAVSLVGTSAGTLVKAALSANFGAYLRINLEVTQGTPAGALAFTVSVDLDLEEEP